MSKKKVFRVQLVETGVYNVDVQAADEDEATTIVMDGLRSGDCIPEEDVFANSGYEFDGVFEIPPSQAGDIYQNGMRPSDHIAFALLHLQIASMDVRDDD